MQNKEINRCLFNCIKYSNLFLLIVFIITLQPLQAQKVKNVKSPVFLNTLPNQVIETSGLIYYQGGLWTINDSGGEACIFKLSLNGKQLLQTICISNATNRDWEEIAEDSQFIYIGDFGNNKGQREILTIYKVNKSNIDSKTHTVIADVINFSYSQRKKSYEPLTNSAYDCEAMVIFKNNIWIFTKNWVDEVTELYNVPNQVGSHIVTKMGTLQVNGLVTAATLLNNSNNLVLLGYHDFVPFVYFIPDFNPLIPNLRKAKRFDLGSIWGRQTEGIAFIDSNKLVISSEKTNNSPPALFELNIIRKKPVVYIPYPDSAIEQ